MRLGDFECHSGSPRLPPGTEGVAIRTGAPPGAATDCWLFGTCRARLRTTLKLRGTLLHSGLVVCSFGPELIPYALPIVGSRLVFPEDIHSEGAELSVFFNLDLSDLGLPRRRSRCYVLAAFHTLVSDVLELDWT